MAIRHFKSIIFGTRLTIYTDNKNLIHYEKITNNRVERWKYELLEFSPSIVHIEGKINSAADALSRINNSQTEDYKPTKEYSRRTQISQKSCTKATHSFGSSRNQLNLSVLKANLSMFGFKENS